MWYSFNFFFAYTWRYLVPAQAWLVRDGGSGATSRPTAAAAFLATQPLWRRVTVAVSVAVTVAAVALAVAVAVAVPVAVAVSVLLLFLLGDCSPAVRALGSCLISNHSSSLTPRPGANSVQNLFESVTLQTRLLPAGRWRLLLLLLCSARRESQPHLTPAS